MGRPLLAQHQLKPGDQVQAPLQELAPPRELHIGAMMQRWLTVFSRVFEQASRCWSLAPPGSPATYQTGGFVKAAAEQDGALVGIPGHCLHLARVVL